MTEQEAKRVLFVRVLEEEAPDLLAPPLRAEAQRGAGDRADLAAWLVRRSAFVCERLPASLAGVAALELPPPALRFLLPGGALLAGALSGLVGPTERIHALVNPAVFLMAWSVAVYAAHAVPWLRRGSTRAASGGPAEPAGFAASVARWLARLAARAPHAGAGGSAGSGTLRARFLAEYATACRSAVLARVVALLHVCAIGFAAGALAGTYLRGVVFEYRVVWGSTLVESPAARAALARVLLWPAALGMGDGFPDAAALARAAEPAGAPAAPWLHAFALCLVAYVIAPRALLALRARAAARRAAADVSLDLSDPYWAGVAAGRSGDAAESLERRVLRWFALDAPSCSVLASLQSELVREDVEAEWRRPRLLGRVTARDGVQQRKDWYGEWRGVVEQGFAAFPESDRPALLDARAPELARAIERVRSAANPFGAELVLLELAAFEAYWPFDPPRRGLRGAVRAALRPRLREDVRERALRRAAERLGLAASAGPALREEILAAGRALSGAKVRGRAAWAAAAGFAAGALALGLAAPFLAGVIGHAMGLHGLAAIHAGLAALASGALAHGAIGLAGGVTVLVGGGALLGLRAGSAPPFSPQATAASILVAGAKVEVFLRSVVVRGHRDTEVAREIVEALRSSVEALREELAEWIHRPDVEAPAARERARALAILERVLARSETFGREQGFLERPPAERAPAPRA